MLDGVRVIAMLTVPVYAEKQNEVNLILRNAAVDSRIVLVDWEGYTPSFLRCCRMTMSTRRHTGRTSSPN